MPIARRDEKERKGERERGKASPVNTDLPYTCAFSTCCLLPRRCFRELRASCEIPSRPVPLPVSHIHTHTRGEPFSFSSCHPRLRNSFPVGHELPVVPAQLIGFLRERQFVKGKNRGFDFPIYLNLTFSVD